MQSSNIVKYTSHYQENAQKLSDNNDYRATKKRLENFITSITTNGDVSFTEILNEIQNAWSFTPLQILDLLSITNSGRQNLCMIICLKKDYNVMQTLLRYLKKEFVNKENIYLLYAFLLLQDHAGFTLGHCIAEKCDAKTNNQFITFLSSLREHGISNRQLYNLLSAQTHIKENLCYNLLRKSDVETTQHFFELLFSLLQDEITAHDVFRYLTALVDYRTEKKSWSIGHQMATRNNADIIIQYFGLLSTLNKLGIRNNVISDYLNTRHADTNSIYETIIKNPSSSDLYKLINMNIFDRMTDLSALGEFKSAIFNHMLTLSEEEKLKALNNALDQTHPLFKFFSIQRGETAPSLTKGYLAKIKKELEKSTTHVITKTLSERATNIIAAEANKLKEQVKGLIKPINIPSTNYVFTPPATNNTAVNVNAASGLYPTYIGNEFFVNPTNNSAVLYHTPPLTPIYYPDYQLSNYSYHTPTQHLNNHLYNSSYNHSLPTFPMSPITPSIPTLTATNMTSFGTSVSMFAPKPSLNHDMTVNESMMKKQQPQLTFI